MPTPLFTLRLPKQTQDTLADLAKLYGSLNTRAFTRELIESIVGGDRMKMSYFLQRLLMKVGEQLDFNFSSKVAAQVAQRVKNTKRATKRGKGPLKK